MVEVRAVLVLSDIDGTLIDDEQRVAPAVQQAIRAYAALGGRFSLASARPPMAMTALATQLGIDTVPLVTLNGALIVNSRNGKVHGKPLFSQPFAPGVAHRVLATIRQHHLKLSLNVFSDLRWLVASIDPWVDQEMAITQAKPDVTPLTAFLATDAPVHKLLCMGDPIEINHLADLIAADEQIPLTFSRSKPTYLELTHPNVSKAAALAHLAELLKVPLSDTMAIGDGDNDIPMVKEAGTGVAMGNATNDLRAIADYVVATNNNAGLAEALQFYAM